MARNSRDSVCLEIVMRNSSQTHWMRSIRRQRTTPWMAGMGPCDDGLQGRAMRVGEFRGLAGRLAVDQALGPMGVELHHPVPHDLNRDPAEPGRRGAGRPLIDRGQGQKAPRLRAVLRRAGNRAQRMGIKVCPERNRHGEPPSFATLNQTCLKPTRPNRVTPSGTWYKTLSNEEWVSATDPDARIARMKDGTTHLAYKPEHAVDLDTGAVVAAEVHAADEGDTTTITSTLDAAQRNLTSVGAPPSSDD